MDSEEMYASPSPITSPSSLEPARSPPQSSEVPPSYTDENASAHATGDVKTRPSPTVDGSAHNAAASGSGSSFYAKTPSSMARPPVQAAPGALPLSFSRPAPGELPYPSFEPMFLVAQGKSLGKGFPPTSPPSKSRPHPFVTHDVNEVDWLTFLNEALAAASLTDKDIRRSHLPIISIVPFVNSLSAYGVQQFMKSRKGDTVVKVIDTWNHHFFEPRKIRAILMKGQAKLSGLNERPIGGLHTPAPSNMSSFTPEKSDDIYRLFVVAI